MFGINVIGLRKKVTNIFKQQFCVPARDGSMEPLFPAQLKPHRVGLRGRGQEAGHPAARWLSCDRTWKG